MDVAVIQKIICCVAAVAVEDEDAVTRARSALRSSMKNLLYAVYLAEAKCTLFFEDHSRI